MDMKEEIMNDAIDDAMEDEGDEEERYMSNNQYNQYTSSSKIIVSVKHN